MVVENRVLMNVVFPSPDSPATYDNESIDSMRETGRRSAERTIIVKAAPRLATILCLKSSLERSNYFYSPQDRMSYIPLVWELSERGFLVSIAYCSDINGLEVEYSRWQCQWAKRSR